MNTLGYNLENRVFMFGFCLKTKRRKEREEERKKRREKRKKVSTSSSMNCEAIISATVKADRLFIESYQTLLCLTTTHTTCSRAKVCRSIQKRKKLIVCFFFFFYLIGEGIKIKILYSHFVL